MPQNSPGFSRIRDLFITYIYVHEVILIPITHLLLHVYQNRQSVIYNCYAEEKFDMNNYLTSLFNKSTRQTPH